MGRTVYTSEGIDRWLAKLDDAVVASSIQNRYGGGRTPFEQPRWKRDADLMAWLDSL